MHTSRNSCVNTQTLSLQETFGYYEQILSGLGTCIWENDHQIKDIRIDHVTFRVYAYL